MKHFQILLEKITRYELPLLLLVCLGYASTVFLFNFHTLDGPAHLYNAKLANDLMFGGSDVLGQFVEFNSFPVPNWIGQGVLSFLLLIFPPLLAEKVLLFLIIFLLPVSFRSLVKSVNGNIWTPYLIFPFCFTFPFFMGFYNFSIAIVVLFWLLAVYLKTNWTTWNNKIWLLCGLALLLYFSHLVIFLFSGICILLILVFKIIRGKKLDWLMTLKTGIIFIIPSILALLYLLNQPEGTPNYLDFSLLLEELETLRTLIVFDFEKEDYYSHKIALGLFVFCIGYFVWKVWGSFRKSIETEQENKLHWNHWDIIPVVSIALYFILPDSNGWAGYVSVRMALLVGLMTVLWLAVNSKKWSFLVIFLALFFNYANLRMLNQYRSQFNGLEYNYAEIEKVGSEYIPDNALLVTKNNPANWFFGHLDNYVGVFQDNVFLTNNYEIKNLYFPLISTDRFNQMYWNNTYHNEFEAFKDVYFLEYNWGTDSIVTLPNPLAEKTVYESAFIRLSKLAK